MNTCSRLESTGKRDFVQCSKETATLLINGGKQHWVQKRSDLVNLKGIGSVQTWWVTAGRERAGSVGSVASERAVDTLRDLEKYGKTNSNIDDRTERLIDWNVQVNKSLGVQLLRRRPPVLDLSRLFSYRFTQMLLSIMKQIVASRTRSVTLSSETRLNTSSHASVKLETNKNLVPLEEVREIIELPEFDGKAAKNQLDPSSVEIPKKVEEELRQLVSGIAAMYRSNPFHNFDHASHVVMSVIKVSRADCISHNADSCPAVKTNILFVGSAF